MLHRAAVLRLHAELTRARALQRGVAEPAVDEGERELTISGNFVDERLHEDMAQSGDARDGVARGGVEGTGQAVRLVSARRDRGFHDDAPPAFGMYDCFDVAGTSAKRDHRWDRRYAPPREIEQIALVRIPAHER